MQNSLKWEKISQKVSHFFSVSAYTEHTPILLTSLFSLFFLSILFFWIERKNAKNKVRGAIMISRDGKMEIQEMIENLMANQMKLSDEIKEQLLNPDLDLADYFD